MRSRSLTLAVSAVVAAAGIVACVDLFHSTDFTTLCDSDAAACAQNPTDAPPSTPDGPIPSEGGGEIDAAPIDFCTWSAPEARAHAERACGWMVACEGAGSTIPRSSYGECLIRARAAYDCSFNPSLRPQGKALAHWTCLANVKSCDGVNTCLFGGANQRPTCPDSKGGSFTACDPDAGSVIECALTKEGDPPTGVESCLGGGRVCSKVNGSQAACAGGRGITCVGGPSCTGTFASECKTLTGVPTDIGTDCTSVGSGRCSIDDGGAGCVPNEDAGVCSGTAKIDCDVGKIASACIGGRQVILRCASFGYGCVPPTTPIDPLSACTETDVALKCTSGSPSADACEGNTLKSCSFGKPVTLDCASIGLGTCVKVTDAFAHCKTP